MSTDSNSQLTKETFCFGQRLTALGFLLMFSLGIILSTLYLFDTKKSVEEIIGFKGVPNFFGYCVVLGIVCTFTGSLWTLTSKLHRYIKKSF
jgi:ABC-type polysaccharide transport system permease subunit